MKFTMKAMSALLHQTTLMHRQCWVHCRWFCHRHLRLFWMTKFNLKWEDITCQNHLSMVGLHKNKQRLLFQLAFSLQNTQSTNGNHMEPKEGQEVHISRIALFAHMCIIALGFTAKASNWLRVVYLISRKNSSYHLFVTTLSVTAELKSIFQVNRERRHH